MEITGFVKEIFDARGGISAKTGNSWKRQQFLIETMEQYPRHFVLEISGEDRIRDFDLHVGEEMKVFFDVDAHEYQGRWYNTINAWKVEKTGKIITITTVQQASAPAPQQAPAQTVAPTPQPQADESGLPF